MGYYDTSATQLRYFKANVQQMQQISDTVSLYQYSAQVSFTSSGSDSDKTNWMFSPFFFCDQLFIIFESFYTVHTDQDKHILHTTDWQIIAGEKTEKKNTKKWKGKKIINKTDGTYNSSTHTVQLTPLAALKFIKTWQVTIYILTLVVNLSNTFYI